MATLQVWTQRRWSPTRIVEELRVGLDGRVSVAVWQGIRAETTPVVPYPPRRRRTR